MSNIVYAPNATTDILTNDKPGFVSKFLTSFGSVKGMKGIFTIILTAAFLAVFELVFFYNIVAPSVEDEMNSNIKKVGKKIASKLNQNNSVTQEKSAVSDVIVSKVTGVIFNDINRAVLNTSAAREQVLVDSINNYTIYTGVAIVLVLAVVLYFLWSKIKSTALEEITAGNSTENGSMTDSIISALITVGILIAFQIMFYFYGKQYRYPGTEGNDELLWVIIDSIDPVDNDKTINHSESEF